VSGPELKTQSRAGPTDAALVVAARAGEAWAQEALFRRYARMVNGLAYRLMGRDADVDDLVQDAFVAAFETLDRLKNPQAFSSWIGSIVVRTAHKRLRRRSLMKRLGLARSEPIDLDALAGEHLAPDLQTEVRRLYSLLERLDPEARIALVLRRVEGLSIPEIAEQMGLSVATVKRRIEAAERRLDVLVLERR
jgi:RNA polymerase sigma-70 factor (ECF subfamily)